MILKYKMKTKPVIIRCLFKMNSECFCMFILFLQLNLIIKMYYYYQLGETSYWLRVPSPPQLSLRPHPPPSEIL